MCSELYVRVYPGCVHDVTGRSKATTLIGKKCCGENEPWVVQRPCYTTTVTPSGECREASGVDSLVAPLSSSSSSVTLGDMASSYRNKLASKSDRDTCVGINGMYAVAQMEVREAARMAETAFCSPDKYARIKVVAMEVRVMATLMAAAMQRTQSWTGIKGQRKNRARPRAAPVLKKGKMKPPRYPPETVNEMATNLAIPTVRHVRKLSISKFSNPDVGHTWGRLLAGPKVEMT